LKLKYFILVASLVLLSCKLSFDANPKQSSASNRDTIDVKAQTDSILYSIENVCKRKDIDKIHSFLKTDASFIIDGEENSLTEIVDNRDKERALGKGSYENVLSSKIKFNSNIAIATIKTEWLGSGILSNNHIRMNTVILEKTGNKWLISYWHASRDH